MIDKITIPVEDGSGECGDCPLLVQCSDGSSHCYVGMAEAEYHVNCSPGPECIPGEYAIIPVDELAALRADSERLGEILTARMNASATNDSEHRIRAENAALKYLIHNAGHAFRDNWAINWEPIFEITDEMTALYGRTALAGKEAE
jgi:hypothetical protein